MTTLRFRDARIQDSLARSVAVGLIVLSATIGSVGPAAAGSRLGAPAPYERPQVSNRPVAEGAPGGLPIDVDQGAERPDLLASDTIDSGTVALVPGQGDGGSFPLSDPIRVVGLDVIRRFVHGCRARLAGADDTF